MAKRKSMNDAPCPVARALDLIGDRWSLLIVRDAFDGVQRFSDFQRSLGVARNILADRLAALVAAQVLALQPAADGSAYQQYRLTSQGEQLFALVVALRQWGERFLFQPGEPHSTLEASNGAQVAELVVQDHHGNTLKPEDTRVKKVE